MKNIFYILLLLPTIIFAQYPSNSGQKITLGEQTTADGLVFRGVASIDTVTATSKITRANKQDTSAFLLLDTVTNLLWHYKTASNGWIQAGGGVSVSSFSAGTTGLTPSTATTGAVTLGGTLSVANGGTGNTSLDAADIVTKSGTQTIGGAKTFTSTITATRFNPTGTTVTGTGMYAPTSQLAFSVTGTNRLTLDANGNMGLNFTNPAAYGGFIIDYAGIGLHTNSSSGASGINLYENGSGRFSIRTLNGVAGLSFFDIFNNEERMRFTSTRAIGIGESSPTAVLHLKAGTATTSTAPLKFTSGVALTTPEVGAMEFSNISGTNRLLISPADNVRKEIAYTDFSNTTGTLSVANGGTGSSNYLTGAIPYSNGTSLISDTSKLFFDNTNNRLSIGTKNPLSKLSVFAATGGVSTGININGSGNIFNMFGSSSAQAGVIFDATFNEVGGSTAVPLIYRLGGTERIRIDVDGNFGIGINAPTQKLHVVGNGLFSGSLSLGTPLAVANGGTGQSTLAANKVMVGNGTSGVLTPTNLHWDNGNSRLGIGVTSPTQSLDVNGKVNITDNVSIKSQSTAEALVMVNRVSDDVYSGIYFKKGNGDNQSVLLNEKDGTFGSTLYFYTNDGTSGGSVNVNLSIAKTGAITMRNLAGINDVGADANGKLQAATSDMNLKNTIENSPFGLNEILLLKPVTFLYNDENRKIDSDVKEVGFIAQDVFDIIPNAVSSTGTGDLQLDYRAITATLVKAIQEQNTLIKALEQRIINLENK